MNSTQKYTNNIVYVSLALMVLGFFANFAQNDYGMTLVGIALAIISFCFAVKIYNYSKHTKWLAKFNAGFLIVVLINFGVFDVLEKTYALPDFIVVPILIIDISFLALIAPIFNIVDYFKNKQLADSKNLLSNYFGNNFILLFCMGAANKCLEAKGASVLMVLSGVMFFFFSIIVSTKYFIKNVKDKTMIAFIVLFLWLFLLSCILGIMFKMQHWPGANSLNLYAGILFILVLVLSIIYYLFSKVFITNVIKTEFNWNILLWLASCIIIQLWFFGRFVDISPKFYSDNIPEAIYILNEKANEFTKEGEEYVKKQYEYHINYGNFLDNRENRKLKELAKY